ncbi:MAG: AMP-binding protein, partial [Thermocrispum sp.]
VRHLTAADDAKLSIQSSTTTEDKLVTDLQEFLHTPFDLARELPFRLGHFTLPGGQSVVCFAAHHIVIDAPSVQILVEELGEIYDAVTATGAVPAALAEPAPLLAEPEPEPEDVQYWLDSLRGVRPDAMRWPGSRPAPARPTFAGHTCSWPMAKRAQQALGALRRECGTSDNVVLMSAFCLTLLRHGVDEDLVIGVPVGTRRPATAKQVGYGVSTMPLRVRINPLAGFRELADRVGAAFFTGIEHADATVERVITARGHGTDDWRVPLFRHMFNYRPWSDEQIRICGTVPDYIEDLVDRSRLDLQCIAVPEPDRLTLRCWHSTEVHDEPEIAAFVARMQTLLQRAGDDPDRPVCELLFESSDDEATWQQVNNTVRTWDGPPTMLERIAAAAATDPSTTAVVDGAHEMSYSELNATAVAVRDRLREHGVRPRQVVALAMPNSAALAAAVLGVWACGASYLPLDTGQPAARRLRLVQDAGATVVLAAAQAPAEWTTLPVVHVPSTPSAKAGPLIDGEAPAPDDPAYVIYTSGSTGQPKGVVVTHRNLHNLVCDFAERLVPEAATAVLWSTTPTFDISALELLLPLNTAGAGLRLD